MRKNIITVYPEVYAIICIALLLLPLKLAVAWLFSVVFHELSHWLAIKLTGGHVNRISIKFSGIQMHANPLSDLQELICAAAGPIGGLLLFFISYKHIPLLAVFSLLHGLYNLIPLFPLDGGRVVRNLFAVIFKERYPGKLNFIFDTSVSLFLLAFVILGMLRFPIGPVPLIMVLIMIFNNKKLKYS